MGATEDIIAKLENAAGGDKTSESPTEVEKQEVAASADDKTESGAKGKGATDRIQELVARAKAAEAKFEEAFQKLQAKEAENSKLIEIAQSNQQDADVIAKINELHKNPSYKDLIEKLDKAIQGKDVEAAKVEAAAVTATPTTTDNAELKAIRAELAATRQQAAAAIADQKQDLLLQKSDVILKELFGQLPGNEYLAKDRQIIQEMLVERIDWDGIESNPATLETKVAGGFAKAIEDYGDPRGRIASQAAKQSNNEPETSKGVDFTKLELGALNDKGKPKLSDDDFSTLLAAELKRSQGR